MALVLVPLVSGSAPAEEPTGRVQLQVGSQVRHSIDPRLFGQFLERPSWGETGPEAATDEAGALPQDIVAMLRTMRIPVVRFPGGTDVDYTDWTDMISNAPGRSGGRPVTRGHTGQGVTNRFGFDEYFRLQRELEWDTILVVNLLDALAKRKPLPMAAQHAAGLVAYVRTPLGAVLPEGMPNWPEVRARNGHPEPYGAKVFQLGNEWWCGRFPAEAKTGAGIGDPAALAAWYRECIIAYADAMRAIDPSLELIVDGDMGHGIEKILLPDPEIRRRIQYVAYHTYAPGRMSEAKRDGKPVAMGTLSAQDWWQAWSSMPGAFDDEGRNIGLGPRIEVAYALGYQVAVTEWNWNGWDAKAIQPAPGFEWRHAAAVGVAGFLNGLIRQAQAVRVANQSMLVGHVWDISAIRFDPEGKVPPHFNAQGAVTAFYNRHRGDRVLEVKATGVPVVEQPYRVGWGSPVGKVALLDTVATLGDHTLYVHGVNRSFGLELVADCDVSALNVTNGPAVLHVLEGVPREGVPAAGAWMRATSRPAEVSSGHLRVSFPPRTVCILEVPVERTSPAP
jgi:alpha-N-arabinofuranosidase